MLPFRSYVCEPMRHDNLLLAGDAARTGAKGLMPRVEGTALLLLDDQMLHALPAASSFDVRR